jgi:hypothetical protein
MVAAQLMSIVAFCVSWLWIVTFILGTVAMILMQTIWCCRLSRCGLIWSIFIAFLTSLSCTTAGILMIVFWKGDPFCSIFILSRDDDDWYVNDFKHGDECNEVAWAVVSFVTGALWAAVGACVYRFVVSGRLARCEEEHRSAKAAADQGQDGNVLELGCVPASEVYSPPTDDGSLNTPSMKYNAIIA